MFAGIGAWSKALEKLDIEHEVVYAAEWDEKTIESYNIIHNSNFKPVDITKVNPEEVPDCDIIFYSPPCQAFSVAGKQEGFEDHRGTLFFDALRIIQAKKPKYAIMENVKGLTQKKFQFEFETMLQLLEQEGYTNYWKVLNAKNYGIPQNRERVFIVSIRQELMQNFDFPTKKELLYKLKDIVGGKILDDRDKGFGVNVYDEYCPTQRANRFGLKVIEPDGNIRKLTVSESMVLTGFTYEDSLNLKNNKVSNSQIYKMAGNSIVVDTVQHILKGLLVDSRVVSNT